jgi:hypothetical protein
MAQRYIMGEGRYSYAYHYNMRIFEHLNGDAEMIFPFYLLKSLTKMSKRVHNNPGTSHKSLFHQGLINMLDMYALREVLVSWKQLLTSLGFDELDPKQKKPKASTREVNTLGNSTKLQEVSPVAR